MPWSKRSNRSIHPSTQREQPTLLPLPVLYPIMLSTVWKVCWRTPRERLCLEERLMLVRNLWHRQLSRMWRWTMRWCSRKSNWLLYDAVRRTIYSCVVKSSAQYWLSSPSRWGWWRYGTFFLLTNASVNVEHRWSSKVHQRKRTSPSPIRVYKWC